MRTLCDRVTTGVEFIGLFEFIGFVGLLGFIEFIEYVELIEFRHERG